MTTMRTTMSDAAVVLVTPRLVGKSIEESGRAFTMWCPGCERTHRIVDGETGWAWDGNIDAPTFSPSILVSHPRPDGVRRCHSFVKAGAWEFLDDCTHVLAGKSVPMVPVPVEEDFE
jgi:hypothetical protein